MSVEMFLKNLYSLEGKTVVFTGAAGGIGSELTKGMAKAGASVALCDVNEKRLNELKKSIESDNGTASVHVMDVTDKDNVQQCVKNIADKYGHIDVLVNCAGINKREGFMDVKEETYDKIMAINLKGVFFVTRSVALYMMKQKHGSIINIGSHNTGSALGGVSIYGATKCGVVAFTRSMAIEWAKYNIRANCISPGHILTPLTTVTWENPARANYLRERIAMRRPGKPNEILGLCILLASDASSYITGSEYRIDGGCLAGGTPWPYDTKY